jgi:hypothetical protein
MHDNMNMNMMNRPDNHEAKMARADLFKCAQYSFKLFKMIGEDQELEGWVQAKITKAADYIASVYHYMEYEMKISEYGDAIENADMYSESIRRAFQQKLTEAKVQAKKAKDKMDKKEQELEEGFPTVADAKARADKEKTTGKFDKKEVKPGVTQYTRKSNTFTDGGDDSDTKKAKKKAKDTNEGIADIAKKAGSAIKKAGSKALDKLGHGSDEDMIKDLQKKTGMPQTGKKPMAVQNEAATTNVPPMPSAKNTSTHGMRDIWIAKYGKTHNANGTPKQPGMMPSGDQSAAEIGRLSDVTGMNAANKKVSPMPVAKNTSTASMRDAWMSKYGKTHNANGTPKSMSTNEAAKPDFLDMDKDGNKKEPMKKAVADKKKNPFAKVKEAATKCNHTAKGKSCPVHGLKECGGM